MLKNLNKKRAVLFAAVGFLLGVLIFAGLRVALVQDHSIHYHANFAVFIDGKREKFDNFTFYEEVQSCVADHSSDPKTRVHMHDQKNSLVHVHDNNSTWGHFFANLGYGLTDESITTLDKTYVDGQNGKKLTFFLNRQPVDFIANRVIESEDTLLIDYGDGRNIDARYGEISRDAQEANTKPDPASCSGATSLTFSDRLKRAFDFTK